MCMCDCSHWCYLFAALKTLVKGGLQRNVPEDHQGFSNSLSRSPRGTGDGSNKSIHHSNSTNSEGCGENDDSHCKNSTTPPHSPHYLTSTVISIEPTHSRSLSRSSGSSSPQLEHHPAQNSELPSPRSPRSRQNSGGSSFSRCGTRGNAAREVHRASMKSITSRNPSSRRPVGGSLKDCKCHQRRNRGGSNGDPYLTTNMDISPRRSTSLRGPRQVPSGRSPQSAEGTLFPVGLFIGSESSVHAARDRNYQKKFNPPPTMSTHSVLDGQWSPLEVGLELWKRKHELQLVQYGKREETRGHGEKVRYNDIGSMEDIRDTDISDPIFPESSGYTEICAVEKQSTHIKHQYRALWDLRATLEEEDWVSAKNPPKMSRIPDVPSLSPTIPPNEDAQALLASTSYSMGQSPERDPMSSLTTSFESNTESVFDSSMAGSSGSKMCQKDVIHHLGSMSHGSLIARRQSYKNVLHKKRLETTTSITNDTGNMTEITTSFDSIETQESTSTETSRFEAVTTSIESTDNTDSAADTHNLHGREHLAGNKIHFISYDIGCGMEIGEGCSTAMPTSSNQGTTLANQPNYRNSATRLLSRRCFSSGSSVETGSNLAQGKSPFSASYSGSSYQKNNDSMLMSEDLNPKTVVFAKVGQTSTAFKSVGSVGNNTGIQSSLSYSSSFANTCSTTISATSKRNFARKWRDCSGFERHSIGSLDSVREPLDADSGGSAYNSIHTTGGSVKGFLFYRYFCNPQSHSAYCTRDYSIDEKSDQLFREFSRCDPRFDNPPFSSPRQYLKKNCRRNSSARGTPSLDLSGTATIPPPAYLTSPVSTQYFSVTSPTKFLIRKVSGSHQHHAQLERRLDHHDENQVVAVATGVVLPKMRFHGSVGLPSIPVITVDDS